jgi:hypothetical protein
MTPRLDWSHLRPPPIVKVKPGQIVIPDDHPPGCRQWIVIDTDDVYALLEPTTAGDWPDRIKRRTSSLRTT